MILKCFAMGKGIITVALILLVFKIIDWILNKILKGNWQLLYKDFKDTLFKIIEWCICLLIIGCGVVVIFYFFYIIGCLI